MVKEKRKTRLDKGSVISSNGEFLGFSAYVQPDSNDAPFRWSPLYCGANNQLSSLFKQIGQKRDGVTKAKALNEIKIFLESRDNAKKEQILVLSHLIFLFHSKLIYDDFPTVRSTALSALNAARLRLPKIWSKLITEHQEVKGMMWCSISDPASEVNSVAVAKEFSGIFTADDWNGVNDYISRILSYARPKLMYDELFARKSGDEAISDTDREQIEERFERIVNTSLSGLSLWFQMFPEIETFQYKSTCSNTLIWKPLSSSKPSLRLRGYQLFGIASQHAKSLVYSSTEPSTLMKQLPILFTQEKEPQNIPYLFEATLLFLTNGDSTLLDKRIMAKNLKKMLSKACFGSSPTLWAPAMLPLFTCIEDKNVILSLTLSMFEGRCTTIGLSDNLLIVSSVAESSCFFLIKEDECSDYSFYESMMKIWVQCLETYLCTSGVTPVSKAANQELESTMGKTLCRLVEASTEKKESGIYVLKDLFWNDILPSVLLQKTHNEMDRRFAALIHRVTLNKKRKSDKNLLNRLLQQKFQLVLEEIRSVSGGIPCIPDYLVLRACLDFDKAHNFFESSNDHELIGIENFFANHILRWLAIHVSQARTCHNDEVKNLLIHDFSILQLVLESTMTIEGESLIWETVIRELRALSCDCWVLDIGLQEICNRPSTLNIVKCQHFDGLVMHIIDDYFQRGLGNNSQDFQLFLKLCFGLESSITTCLVGSSVPLHLMNKLNGRDSDPTISDLLDILCDLVGSDYHFQDDFKIEAILKVWKNVGDAWEVKGVSLLKNVKIRDIRLEFYRLAEIDIRASLVSGGMISYDLNQDEVLTLAKEWSIRACRWFHSYSEISGFDKLERLGLVNFEIWRLASFQQKPSPSFLLLCTLNVLGTMNIDMDRFLTIFGEHPDSDRLRAVSLMLITASNISYQGVLSHISCDALISLFGRQMLFENCLIYSIVETMIEMLFLSIQESQSSLSPIACVVGISDSIFSFMQPYLSTALFEQDGRKDSTPFKEGDEIWYLDFQNNEKMKRKAIIVKVHREDFPRLFFTLHVDEDGHIREKQTILERLRPLDDFEDCMNECALAIEQDHAYSMLATLLFEKVVKPSFQEKGNIIDHYLEASAECINIIFCLLGVNVKNGMEALIAEVMKILHSLQTILIEDIEGSHWESASLKLKSLALALGYRELPVKKPYTLTAVHFDTKNSLQALAKAFDENRFLNVMDSGTLMLAIVSFDLLEKYDLKERVTDMISAIVIAMECECKEQISIVIRAMRCVLIPMTIPASLNTQDAISKLIFLFAVRVQPLCRNFQPLYKLLESACVTEGKFWIDACGHNLPYLIDTLKDSNKHWIAFRLLCLASKRTTPHQLDISVETLPEATRLRLKKWEHSLIEEERHELVDDLLHVYEWVPHELLLEIEGWIEDDSIFDLFSEDDAIARMLCWLAFIRYLESSAKYDARNRGCFSSYATKSGCIFFILSYAVQFLNVQGEKKFSGRVYNTDNLFSNNQVVNLTELSRTVFLHTLEMFPMLSRKWWEEECPKACSKAVNKFVELAVAPETLKRELDRIFIAMKDEIHSHMSVNGSIVSREIIATYNQDECTLSLVIHIPSNFPFGSVDVDGKKTLGVSKSRFNRWALQIRQILSYQDGSLFDALMFWRRNIEKEFDGVEPCPVCYSVLAVKSYELPNLQCKTCRNIFHSSCLHKWFASSGKSLCVICQQPWSGSKIT